MCISFDAAGQTHLEAALSAHILYSGSGNPALRHSDIISPMPRPQLSKTFCLYRTFTNNGFCGFDSCSDFIFRIPVGRKSSRVFYLHTVIINGYAHRTSGFFVRPMLKNGVPSEVTLCRVEHGIDNSALAKRMQEFAKSFHRRLSKADGDKEIILWMAKPSATLYRPTNASLILCQHIPTTPASHWLPKPAKRKTMR